MASKKGSKSNAAASDFGFRHTWEFLRRRWKSPAVCIVAAWILGLVYCYFGGQWYQSAGQLFLMQKDSTSVVNPTSTNGGSKESEISEDLLATHMQLVHSERIIKDALAKRIRLSTLEEMKGRQKVAEALTSTNLRLASFRMFGPASSDAAVILEEPSTGIFLKPLAIDESGLPAETATADPATAVPAADATATVPAAPGATASEVPAAVPAVPVVPTVPLVEIDETSVPVDPAATSDPAVATTESTTEITDIIELRDLPGIKENLDVNERPIDYVIDHMIVTRGGAGQEKDSKVLGIAFRHTDAVEARLICLAVIEAYQEFLAEKFQSVGSEAAGLIEKASKELLEELKVAENNYKLFREQSPIILSNSEGGTQDTNIHRVRYSQYQADLITVQSSLAETRSRIGVVERELTDLERRDAPMVDRLALIDDKNVTRLGILVTVENGQANSEAFQENHPERLELARARLQSLTKLKADQKSLATTLGPEHPEMKNIVEQIKVVEEAIQTSALKVAIKDKGDEKLDARIVVDTYLRLLRNDVTSKEKQEQELLELIAMEEEAAKSLIGFELEGERLVLEVRRAQELYDAVVARVREINLAKDYSGFINEIVRTPENGMEVWPHVPIVIALSTVLGGLAGLGLALGFEYRDRSFKDPDDVRRYFDAPLLTHVPNLVLPAAETRQIQRSSPVHSSIMAYHKPQSREAEVFRGLRTSILFMRQDSKCPVLAFTSPNKGDGKSTVTANLAVSLAQAGRKVLLVDCDMRRPNVHKLFSLTNEKGLSDVLTGANPEGAYAVTPDLATLKILPAGSHRKNPAELLMSAAFKELLARSREEYDIVLLDCPPVLAVADPCIVGSQADGIVAVLRLSRDTKPQATRARDMLSRVGATILGVVVNVAEDAERTGYGKYSDAGYGYDYGYKYNQHNRDYYTETEADEEVLS